MRRGNAPLLALAISALLLGACSAEFLQQFKVTWAGSNANNVIPDGLDGGAQLRLDPSGGATFNSYETYLFGSFSARVKLVEGDSAGTVSAFFLSSPGPKQDEIDFEFLGNSSGEPYKLHTNLFVGGVGNREEQLILWFDPTADFHTYSVVWNSKQVTWSVDDTPIRIYKNIDPKNYPRNRPMAIFGTIFDASSWATQGGLVPINYDHSPFIVTFENFSFSGCSADSASNVLPCKKNLSANWWEGPNYVGLSPLQRSQLQRVQTQYMTYSYCTASPTPPVECSANTA